MRVLLASLLDDPFDPPGYERIGGGHVFVFDLGRHLVRHGHDVTYLVRRSTPERSQREQIGPRCCVLRVDAGPLRDVAPESLVPFLAELTDASLAAVGDAPVDVVHSHYWLSGYVARVLIGRRRARHVHSVLSLGRTKAAAAESAHTSDGVRDAAEVEVFNRADAVIVTCPSERDDLRRLYPEVRGDHVHVIPYGVDPDVFFPRPAPPHSVVHRATARFPKEPDHVP
jgi:D-inositol-3-phosphate glycosyltransferase